MEDFHLSGTITSPEVFTNINEGILVLRGSSVCYGMNWRQTYIPIITEWLSNYTKSALCIDIRLSYLNTTSIEHLTKILKSLSEYATVNFTINWHYESEDEDMKELGEIILKDLVGKKQFISHHEDFSFFQIVHKRDWL